MAKAKGTKVKATYQKNYLTQVIARIDFGAIPALSSSGPPAAITKVLKKGFPYPEQKKLMMRSIRFGFGEGKTEQEAAEDIYQWFYYSENRDKTVHITGDCMYVEYKKYKSFDTLNSDFLMILDAIYKAFPDLQVTRMGLRYVDNIEMPTEKNPTDWSAYLDPRLLSIFDIADDASTISRAFQILEFNYGTYNMRFQYGMHNADYPAPIRKKVFTLDYDAYCQSLLERQEIADNLVTFHGKIKASFEEVITEGLRRKMRKSNA